MKIFVFCAILNCLAKQKEVQEMIGFVLKFIIHVKGSHYGYSLQASKNLAVPLVAYNGLNICAVYFVFL